MKGLNRRTNIRAVGWGKAPLAVLPSPSHDRRLVDTAPGHQRPDDACHLVRQRNPNQHRGLRDSRSPSHVPGCASRWTCRLMITLLAPMISKRLNDRSPIFVVAPNRCLPPVECCRGTTPSQVAKSRALRNVSERLLVLERLCCANPVGFRVTHLP